MNLCKNHFNITLNLTWAMQMHSHRISSFGRGARRVAANTIQNQFNHKKNINSPKYDQCRSLFFVRFCREMEGVRQSEIDMKKQCMRTDHLANVRLVFWVYTRLIHAHTHTHAYTIRCSNKNTAMCFYVDAFVFALRVNILLYMKQVALVYQRLINMH